MVNRRVIRLAMLTALAGAGCLFCSAQSNKGTITPVDRDDDAPPQPVLHYYDKHGERLETPVLYLADLDTVKGVKPSSPYPLYNGFSIGVNFIDAILKATGQKHQSYDISASVSLHNWFFPIVEAGIGWGEHRENNGLYNYKAKPSFYAKVGMNYNFLYKSSPDYMAYIGLRLGMTRHNWDITDIKPDTDMATSAGGTELLGQSCFSIYGEVVAGLKVKIVGPLSLGWNIRYRAGQHNSGGMAPWFVPGSGTNALGFNFSAFLTFGTKKRKDAITDAIDAAAGTLPDTESPEKTEETEETPAKPTEAEETAGAAE